LAIITYEIKEQFVFGLKCAFPNTKK